MDARFYKSEEIDITRLANDLENIYRAQNYTVQQLTGKDQVTVQLKKGGDLEKLVGMGVALSVVIQRNAGGVIALIGQQQWVDKAAAGAVGAVGLVLPVLLPLAVTAGVGAIRQASLGNNVLNMVDSLIRQQYPNVQAGPIPVQLMPQLQQQYQPYPQYGQSTPYGGQQPYNPSYVPPYTPPTPNAPAQPQQGMTPPQAVKQRCSSCNTPYEIGDTFCTGCGRALVAPKKFCSNCKAELKDDTSFCPKCGASTFQSSTTVQAPTPAPAPQTPTYSPSAPTVPAYTPPVAQPQVPPTVVTPPKPVTPPYVPPVPQQPAVVPQPTVTIIPATPKQESPAAPKQPATPQTPVYTPPVNPQPPVAHNAQTPPPAPKPILAKPVSQPVSDPTAPWGLIDFSDGKQVKLSGEHVVVGRYDHDLGGINPDVDLASNQGSDTVSRVHAMIEHIGSTYMLTDLNSTNSTRINGKRLEPDKATPINDGDTLHFGKVTGTFKKL